MAVALSLVSGRPISFVSQLYAPKYVARPEAELADNLIPAFRQREDDYRIHSQVTAGWYQAPDAAGIRHPFAVSLQLVSTRARRNRRRFGVNVVGIGPGGDDDAFGEVLALQHLAGVGGVGAAHHLQ